MAYSASPIASLAANLGVNGGTSGTFNSAGADIVCVWVAYDNNGGGGHTVSDNKGNTYVALTARGTVGDGAGRLWYANAFTGAFTAGAGHTVTVTGSSTFASVAVTCVSGSKTAASPFDQQNGALATTGTTVLPNHTAGVTPVESDELCICGLTHDVATSSINAGFTQAAGIGLVGGTAYGAAIAYKVQTAAALEDPTWTTNASAALVGGFATFKAAAGGGAAQVPYQPNYFTAPAGAY